MEIDIQKLIQKRANMAGKEFAKELQKSLENNENTNNKNINNKDFNMEVKKVEIKTADMKVELQKEIREYIKKYQEIYEIKNGEEYMYSSDLQFPKYLGQCELSDGFYNIKNGKLIYDGKITSEINEGIKKITMDIANKEENFLDSCRKNGEEYSIDEIGDDEKYIYLTRKSDGKEFQEFKITDELYKQLLINNDNVISLYYEDGEYKIKK